MGRHILCLDRVEPGVGDEAAVFCQRMNTAKGYALGKVFPFLVRQSAERDPVGEGKPPARPQYAETLAEQRPRVGDMEKGLLADRPVEAFRTERQACGITAHEAHSRLEAHKRGQPGG